MRSEREKITGKVAAATLRLNIEPLRAAAG